MITSFSSETKDTQDDTLTTGMGNNEYVNRPWHLPEETHATNWGDESDGRESSNGVIRIGLLSGSFPYRHPHPPIVSAANISGSLPRCSD